MIHLCMLLLDEDAVTATNQLKNNKDLSQLVNGLILGWLNLMPAKARHSQLHSKGT